MNDNLWIYEEQEQIERAYWTIRYYKPSGIGTEQEWTNVYAANEAEAKDFAITNYRIAQGNTYRVYAFQQEGRM